MSDLDPSKLKLVLYPALGLRRKCEAIKEFGQELQAVADQMLTMMAESNGVGLAGPQVGIQRRIFVCNHTGEPEDDLVLINPVLEDLEGGIEADEGCLSIPDVVVKVRRAEHCRILATTPQGERFEKRGEGLLARVWQHENDHLDGRLILDYMDEADRLTNRKAVKHLEERYESRR
jgi:peptide deformylase